MGCLCTLRESCPECSTFSPVPELRAQVASLEEKITRMRAWMSEACPVLDQAALDWEGRGCNEEWVARVDKLLDDYLTIIHGGRK